MNEKDEREELYNEFVKNLKSANNAYYDEDDLVEIYNYAEDVEDDYVRMEVLFAMSRLYPDSHDLRLKKALFFYDTVRDAKTAAGIVEGLKSESLYDRLVKLKISDGTDESRMARLQELVAKASSFNEDEVILVSDIAEDAGGTEWLFSNRDKIAAKCVYKPTFFFDLVKIATDVMNRDVALEAAEQLTSIEPLNEDFWEIYARACLDFGEYEKAVTAADYALAINPDNDAAQETKVVSTIRLSVNDNGGMGIPLEQIEKAYGKNPANIDLAKALVTVYAFAGRKKAMVDVIKKTAPLSPDAYQLIVVLLHVDIDEAIKVLTDMFENGFPMPEDALIGWATIISRESDMMSAATVMQVYDTVVGLTYGRDYLYELWYRAEGYEIIKELFDREHSYTDADDFENGMRHELLPNELLTYILSLVRTGKESYVLSLIEEWCARLETNDDEAYFKNAEDPLTQDWNLSVGKTTVNERVIKSGVLHVLTQIKDALASKDFINAVNKVDPFRS